MNVDFRSAKTTRVQSSRQNCCSTNTGTTHMGTPI